MNLILSTGGMHLQSLNILHILSIQISLVSAKYAYLLPRWALLWLMSKTAEFFASFTQQILISRHVMNRFRPVYQRRVTCFARVTTCTRLWPNRRAAPTTPIQGSHIFWRRSSSQDDEKNDDKLLFFLSSSFRIGRNERFSGFSTASAPPRLICFVFWHFRWPLTIIVAASFDLFW